MKYHKVLPVISLWSYKILLTFELSLQAFLLAYIQETEERLNKKAALRTQNLAVAKDRPELNTAMLDSSLKKNTAFIKKLVSKNIYAISFLPWIPKSSRN